MIYIYAINTYKDLCTEIEICKINIEGIKKELKVWEDCLKPPKELGCQQYSDMPHGSMNATTMDRVIPKIAELQIQLERQEMILKAKIDRKELMNSKLTGLTGQDYKIIKFKEIYNLNNIQISERLNISERTVRRTVARVNERKRGE